MNQHEWRFDPRMRAWSVGPHVCWLVVWLPFFLFSQKYWEQSFAIFYFPINIGNVIIPTDELHHFSEGWPWPTKQSGCLPLVDPSGFTAGDSPPTAQHALRRGSTIKPQRGDSLNPCNAMRIPHHFPILIP